MTAGRRGDDIKIVFALQALLYDFHMQKTQKSASEAESKGNRCLGLKHQGCVIELKFFQRIPQVIVFCPICRVYPAKDHGHCFLISRKRLAGGIGCQCDVSPHALRTS